MEMLLINLMETYLFHLDNREAMAVNMLAILILISIEAIHLDMKSNDGDQILYSQ